MLQTICAVADYFAYWHLPSDLRQRGHMRRLRGGDPSTSNLKVMYQ